MHKPYFCYLREVVSLFLALTVSNALPGGWKSKQSIEVYL